MIIESTDWIRDAAATRRWKEAQQWWWIKNDAKGRLYNPKKVRFRGDDEFEAEVRFKYLATEQFRHTFKADLPAGSYTLGAGPSSSPHCIRQPFEVPVNAVNTWEDKAGVELYFRVDDDDLDRLYFERRARNEGALLARPLIGVWEDAPKDAGQRKRLLLAHRSDKNDIGVREFIEMRSRAYMEMDDYYCASPGGGFSPAVFFNVPDLGVFAERHTWRKLWAES